MPLWRHGFKVLHFHRSKKHDDHVSNEWYADVVQSKISFDTPSTRRDGETDVRALLLLVVQVMRETNFFFGRKANQYYLPLKLPVTFLSSPLLHSFPFSILSFHSDGGPQSLRKAKDNRTPFTFTKHIPTFQPKP